jgi:hypothetical protein
MNKKHGCAMASLDEVNSQSWIGYLKKPRVCRHAVSRENRVLRGTETLIGDWVRRWQRMIFPE